MVQVQHRRRRRSRVNTKSFRCLIFTPLVLFAITTVRRYQKSFSSSASFTSIADVSKVIRHSSDSTDKNVGKVKCESYGCPLRPPELTQTIRDEIALDTVQRTVRYPYGNQNMVGFTQQGKDHPINQDRGIIISPFHANNADESNRHVDASNKDFLIGIFDGHGTSGHVISQYLQDNFAKRLYEKMETILHLVQKNDESLDNPTDASIIKALKETFTEMDRDVPPDAANDGGSTASIIYRVGSKLFFANAGDSLSFLALLDNKSSGSSGGESSAKIVHRNRYDKAHLPEEKERIERVGGRIHVPPGHPKMARVVAFYPQNNDMMSLAMSRSIGDWPHGKIGVIPDPIVDVVDLDELFQKESSSSVLTRKEDMELFVVSSSDGLYDHRQPQFVANRLATSFFNESAENVVSQCINIIDLATPKDPTRYRDDITLMALRVDM